MQITNIVYNLTQNTGDYLLNFTEGAGSGSFVFPVRQFPLYLDQLQQQEGFFMVAFDTADNGDLLMVYSMDGFTAGGGVLNFALTDTSQPFSQVNNLRSSDNRILSFGLSGVIFKRGADLLLPVVYTFNIEKSQPAFGDDWGFDTFGVNMGDFTAIVDPTNPDMWLVTIQLTLNDSFAAPAVLGLNKQP